MRTLLIFICFFSLASANATMFSRLSFEKQVEEASSAVEVTLEKSRVFRNANQLIMTEYAFKVNESFNFPEEDLVHSNLILNLPGGTIDGVTSFVDSAPEFKYAKNYFLLIKKINNQIYLSNFTLGEYEIQRVEDKTYYVSTVFPFDPEIGRIEKEKMLKILSEKWKFSNIIQDKNSLGKNKIVQKDLKEKHFRKRLPASISDREKENHFLLWGLLSLLVLTMSVLYFRMKKNEK